MPVPALDEALIDLLPAAVYTCEAPSGVITRYNRRAAELWGREPKLGDPNERFCGSFKLYYPNGACMGHGHTPMAEVLRTGIPARNREAVIERPDGSRVAVLVNIAPIKNDEGVTVGAVNVLQDITERKRAEQGLSQQNQLIQAITDNATLGLLMMDAGQHCTFMNPAAEKMTGFTLAEVQGLALHDVIHHMRPGGRRYPMSECPIDRALPQNNQEQGEEVFVRKDGTFYPVAYTASPILENGIAVGTVIEVRDITEEKRAEEASRQLAAIVESSHDAIIGFTLDGVIETWNAGAERTYGYAASEVLGRLLAMMVPPDRSDELPRNLGRLRRGERVEHYETVRLRKDGVRIDVALTMSPIKDQAGRIVGASGIGRDITEQKRAARRAALQYQVNRMLIECLDFDDVAPRILDTLGQGLDWQFGALWTMDRQANVLRCRHTWQEPSLAVPDFEALTRQMTFPAGVGLPGRVWGSGQPAWITDVLADTNFPRARAAAKNGLHGALGFPLRSAEGPLGVVEFFSPEIRPPDEGLLLLMGVVGNEIGQAIERMWAEDERRQLLAREQAARTEAEAAQRRAAFLAEASAALAASLDYETTLATVARLAIPDLADWCLVDLVEADQSLRRVAVVHSDPAKVELARELHRRYPPLPDTPAGPPAVVRTGRAELVAEIPDSLLVALARDAEHLRILRGLRFTSYLCVPLAARGRLLGALSFAYAESGRRYGPADLALAEDLARRAALSIDNGRLYREAQEAVRAREIFLARASHELRTPLTSALGTIRLLPRAMDGRLMELPGTLVDITRRNLDTMLALINDLLDASKLASGQEPLGLEATEVETLLHESLEVVGAQAREKGVRLEMVVPPALSVTADPVRLEQVLVNLLANAVKFTPAGGQVTVDAARDAEGLVIRVRDTGEGIAPEHLEAIFEPFYQARVRGPRRPRGTGLGLAICRQIVTLHGGRIWAESEGPGCGSTFVVRLPGVAADDRAA